MIIEMYILLIFLCAIHFGYIFLAVIYPKKNNREKRNGKKYSIEHIVCFKNESKFIEKKLQSCYEIDYPGIHHTFVNDNSTDDSLELLNKYKREKTRIICNETDLGKNQSQIKAVRGTKSDFLLFTDANVFLERDSLNKIVRQFNKNTGGVCGNVTITTDMKHQGISGKYWQIEKKIKAFQSIFHSVIGFDGGFYCIKRENYKLKRENELSDFESAFLIFEQQKQTKFANNALATELEQRTVKRSFMARIRASNRVFWSFRRISKYIYRLKPAALIHFTLHKLVRYLLIIVFVLSIPLLIIDLLEVTPFLILIFFVPTVHRFVLESIALCIGGILALTGKEYTTWSDKKA